ncbi:helix-turn-helix domain-containing protein [Numidum massiliense]|uniref:helix-turn-helix domain-containing protein n=1 Tax=Numidum massiliense TaxID=1522315 RepID=UPI0006D53CB3|nr:helix-turn-helix transcriptional regulator [Numidum massiliense]
MNFSEVVKQALKVKDLTPSQLARLTGYSPQYIHSLLKGDKRWNETTLNKTFKVLDLEIKVKQKEQKQEAI